MRSGNRERRGMQSDTKFKNSESIACCAPEPDLGNGPVGWEQKLILPAQAFRLQEANLPAQLASSLAGREVTVQIFPEEAAGIRRVERGTESSFWMDPEGNCWNDYHPVRVLYTDSEGRAWHFPRKWLNTNGEPLLDASCPVTRRMIWREKMNLPTEWDLQEINIDPVEAAMAAGKVAEVEVHADPQETVRVLWRDGSRRLWRIPHAWRRRRIRLPDCGVLISQGIPAEVAEAYAGKVVSVNYHPGSLCCLADSYRFRDGEGNRWPVRMRDCLLLGYGDGEARRVQ